MRKKIKNIFLVILVVIILGVLLMFLVKNKENKSKIVCIKENCFIVEIADSEAERELGLMNRETLDNDKGMLFVFLDEGIRYFWMKNTLIPLDIIFINLNMEIVDIAYDSLPCLENEDCGLISSSKEAMYVLEINPISKEKNLSIGDKIVFKD